MSNANCEVVAAWFEQVWNAGDKTAIDRLMAPTATFHGLPTPDGKPVVGPAAYKPFVQTFRQAFPDMQIRIERMVCEGDLVACHCTVTGTHTGPGLGKPSGSPMKMEGMAIATIRDGQVHEAWNCFDFMTLYQQIGMLPALPTA